MSYKNTCFYSSFIVLQQRNNPPVQLGVVKRFSKDTLGELKASRIEENKTSQYNEDGIALQNWGIK